MLLMIARSRSRWPCQSMPTSAPLSLITCAANRTTADGAPRRGVADGVGEADALRAGADRAVDRAARSVSGSARVVSSVTYITSRPSLTANVIASSVLFSSQSSVQPFGVLPDRRRADERADFDRQAGALADLDDRRDVGDRACAPRSWRAPSAWRSTISRASRSTSRDDVRAGAGQADVGGVDAELVDQVQDLDLLLDGRRPHRRRLQPVAQRLVVEHHARAAWPARRSCSSRRSGIRAFTDCRSRTRRADGVSGDAACRRRRSATSHTRGIAARRRAPCGRKPSLMVSAAAPAGAATICDRTNAMAGDARLPVERDVEDDEGEDEPEADRRALTRPSSFRSGVLHDQRRHVVVLLGAAGECP